MDGERGGAPEKREIEGECVFVAHTHNPTLCVYTLCGMYLVHVQHDVQRTTTNVYVLTSVSAYVHTYFCTPVHACVCALCKGEDG